MNRQHPLPLVGFLLPFLLSQSARAGGEPQLDLSTRQALVDEVVSLRAIGLEPGQACTLRSRTLDRHGRSWEATANFAANPQGVVDLARQAPGAGSSYTGVDAMGLIWSAKLVGPKQGKGKRFSASLTQPFSWPRVLRFLRGLNPTPTNKR